MLIEIRALDVEKLFAVHTVSRYDRKIINKVILITKIKSSTENNTLSDGRDLIE